MGTPGVTRSSAIADNPRSFHFVM